MSIEQLCADANSRVAHHINRSAGQHLRALRPAAPVAPTSSEIFAMAMESDTAYRFRQWLCSAAGVDFPPINKEKS